jgi:hypothetical protein
VPDAAGNVKGRWSGGLVMRWIDAQNSGWPHEVAPLSSLCSAAGVDPPPPSLPPIPQRSRTETCTWGTLILTTRLSKGSWRKASYSNGRRATISDGRMVAPAPPDAGFPSGSSGLQRATPPGDAHGHGPHPIANDERALLSAWLKQGRGWLML